MREALTWMAWRVDGLSLYPYLMIFALVHLESTLLVVAVAEVMA